MAHEIHLKVGDFILKDNGNLFGRKENKVPVVKIKRITHAPGRHLASKKMVRVNGTYDFSEYMVKVISPERAEEINALYESCKEINVSLKPDLNTSCFREDNGQPKVPIDPSAAQKLLYQFRMRNPEGGYEVYECKHCGNLHLGKTRDLLHDIILL
jgi:hypothetical protein